MAELTEKQMEDRFRLLQGWKIGYIGGTVNDVSTGALVSLAKFINECHPDLSLGEAEDKLFECFVSMVEPSISDQIERGLGKAAQKAKINEDMTRAICYGLAMRYSVSQTEFTAESLLKEAPKALSQALKNEALEPQWDPTKENFVQ